MPYPRQVRFVIGREVFSLSRMQISYWVEFKNISSPRSALIILSHSLIVLPMEQIFGRTEDQPLDREATQLAFAKLTAEINEYLIQSNKDKVMNSQMISH